MNATVIYQPTSGLRDGTKRQALVIAPEKSSGVTCAAMLRRVGIEAREAGDADSAWRSLFDQRVDLLLIDFGFPGSMAVGFLRRMRRAGMTQPAILIRAASPSALGSTSDASKEFDAVIFRPFTYYELMTAAAEFLTPHSREARQTISKTQHEDTKIKTRAH